jgi:SAM-dependent methyltransferase
MQDSGSGSGRGLSLTEANLAAFDASAESGAYARVETSTAHRLVVVPAMFGQIAKHVGPDLKGMDVLCPGCGAGGEMTLLSGLGPRSLTGIELSPKMAEVARRRNPGATVHSGDLAEIELGNLDLAVAPGSRRLQ